MSYQGKKKLGILGGGQLGLMLIQSAIDYDLYVKVLDPDPNASCSGLAHEFVCGDFRDFDTVISFAKDCEIVTIEIESVNLDALKVLQKQGIKVYPQPEKVEIIKNKRLQKQFFAENQIPSSAFVLINDANDFKNHVERLPFVQKLGEGGYDGKGVQIMRTVNDFSKAFEEPSLIEDLVDFEKELAVIVARNASGQSMTYEIVEMVFHPEANLVEYLFAPANLTQEQAALAREVALKTADAFEIVGLLAVEMFLTKSGEILVNEVAPRPHNSGHHTQKANAVSQFSQHIRAILDLPLDQTPALLNAAMVNILGSEGFEGEAVYEGYQELLQVEGVHPFLYGKKVTKPFRKMGHVTVLDKDFEKLLEKVKFVQKTLKVVS